MSVRPGLTEAERAAIDYLVEPHEVVQVGAGGPVRGAPGARPVCSPAAAAPCRPQPRAAQSCPPELVALLAADDDPGVRVVRAQHHPEAPPELLLRCYLEYTGMHRDRLLGLPRFPVAGLADRFGTAEDPAVRLPATLDPQADPVLVDALTRDPEPRVRAGAARNPSLPRESMDALLDFS